MLLEIKDYLRQSLFASLYLKTKQFYGSTSPQVNNYKKLWQL